MTVFAGLRRVLRALIPHAHSVLLIPITLPSGLVPAPRRSLFGAAIPHHVTILYPFVAPSSLDADVVAAVETVAGAFTSFAFRLTAINRFPDATYLVIDPEQPFLELISAFERAWPQFPRYGGRFATTIPHVTLVERPSAPALEERVAARLPVAVEAERVEIWRSGFLRGWQLHWGTPLRPR